MARGVNSTFLLVLFVSLFMGFILSESIKATVAGPNYQTTIARLRTDGNREGNKIGNESSFVHPLSNDWCLFGDERTVYQPPNQRKDIPEPTFGRIRDKVNSYPNTSLIGEMLQQVDNGTPTNHYKGCGISKVFYEGWRFMGELDNGCRGSAGMWTNAKKEFYTKLYTLAAQYRCLELVDGGASADYGSVGEFGRCNSRTTINGIGIHVPISGNFQNYATVTVTFPPGYSRYLVPSCHIAYATEDDWKLANVLADGVPDNRQVTQYLSGEVIDDWSQDSDTYPGTGTKFFYLECDRMLVLDRNTIQIKGVSGQILVPRFAYGFKEPEDCWVSVVQSIPERWYFDKTSSSREACSESPRCQFYNIGEYHGEIDEGTGSAQARKLFSKLDQLATCKTGRKTYVDGLPPRKEGANSCNQYGSYQNILPKSKLSCSRSRALTSRNKGWRLILPGGEIGIPEWDNREKAWAESFSLESEVGLPDLSEWEQKICRVTGEWLEEIEKLGGEINNEGEIELDLTCTDCYQYFLDKEGRIDISDILPDQIPIEIPDLSGELIQLHHDERQAYTVALCGAIIGGFSLIFTLVMALYQRRKILDRVKTVWENEKKNRKSVRAVDMETISKQMVDGLSVKQV